MKTIAPYDGLVIRLRQRKGLLDLGRSHRHLDRREMCGSSSGARGTSASSSASSSRRDARRSRMTQAAMDDTVAESREPPIAKPLSGPPQYRRQFVARHSRRCHIELRRRNGFPIGPHGARRRMSADPLHLAAEKCSSRNEPLGRVCHSCIGYRADQLREPRGSLTRIQIASSLRSSQ